MSYADEMFISTCKDILENGVWDTDMEVRPRWEDGTPAHTVKKFGVVNRYDLSKEFPAVTIRRTAFKSAIDTKAEGLVLGVGAKIFTVAGPVILYGILSGTVYGVIL